MDFSCGCKYDKLNFDKIPLDCPATWDFISTGLTKGVFQLEKSLGKKWTKEIKPRSVDELGAVISLIRPGCLEAKFRQDPKTEKDITIIDTYVKVKNGELEPEYIDPILEPIFKDTYSVPIYQEQIMRICSEFAGFTLKEADDARKAVGKKLADKMAALKDKFVNGAKKQGHEEGLAEVIFGWIEKFSGYGFNKSHAISYALIGYQTAYAKVHFPLEFFKAMLTNSEGKQDSLEEIEELVNEAKLFNISVRPPNLSLINEDFAIQDRKTIAFGLAHIKGVGSSSISALKKIAKAKTPREFLYATFYHGPKKRKMKKSEENPELLEVDETASSGEGKVNKTVVEALIKSGALDHLSQNRIKFLQCYRILSFLTDRERKLFFEKFYTDGAKFDESITSFLSSTVPNKTRTPKITEAIKEIQKEVSGNIKKLSIAWEKHYLGVPLSGSLVELYNNHKVDTKVRNLIRLKSGTFANLGVVIESVKKFKDRNGNWMAILTVSDETYRLDSVMVFARQFNDLGWILEEGKPVLICGKKDKQAFIANKIEHL